MLRLPVKEGRVCAGKEIDVVLILQAPFDDRPFVDFSLSSQEGFLSFFLSDPLGHSPRLSHTVPGSRHTHKFTQPPCLSAYIPNSRLVVRTYTESASMPTASLLDPLTNVHIHIHYHLYHPSSPPVSVSCRGSSDSYVIAALPALVALWMLDVVYHAVIGVPTKILTTYMRGLYGRQKRSGRVSSNVLIDYVLPYTRHCRPSCDSTR